MTTQTANAFDIEAQITVISFGGGSLPIMDMMENEYFAMMPAKQLKKVKAIKRNFKNRNLTVSR